MGDENEEEIIEIEIPEPEDLEESGILPITLSEAVEESEEVTFDTPDRLLNSTLAYQILRVLFLSQDELYAKEIAEELNRSSNSVSNYLKLLRDNGLIERGKRTQAQYYKIDPIGVGAVFDHFWNVIWEKYTDTMAYHIKTADDRPLGYGSDVEQPPVAHEGADEIERVHDLFWSYSRSYFRKNPESTIREMYVRDFAHAVMFFYLMTLSSEEEEFHPPEWFMEWAPRLAVPYLYTEARSVSSMIDGFFKYFAKQDESSP